VAIVALNIEANEDNDFEFLERAMGFYESAGMATLFERVYRRLVTRQSRAANDTFRDVDDTLARFAASVLEAAKRCGSA
jgi:hypothetical protein